MTGVSGVLGVLGGMGVWGCGSVGVWEYGSVGVWECGSMGVWGCGGVGVWECGGMGVWECGGVGVWGCGSVGVWECGGVGVLERNYCSAPILTNSNTSILTISHTPKRPYPGTPVLPILPTLPALPSHSRLCLFDQFFERFDGLGARYELAVDEEAGRRVDAVLCAELERCIYTGGCILIGFGRFVRSA